jgi:hypothetical protein
MVTTPSIRPGYAMLAFNFGFEFMAFFGARGVPGFALLLTDM